MSPEFINPGVSPAKDPSSFYSEKACAHLGYVKNLFTIFKLRIESYEFNCRDSWTCPACGCRVDPHELLGDNYDVKG